MNPDTALTCWKLTKVILSELIFKKEDDKKELLKLKMEEISEFHPGLLTDLNISEENWMEFIQSIDTLPMSEIEEHLVTIVLENSSLPNFN